jgi:hypothetical protein
VYFIKGQSSAKKRRKKRIVKAAKAATSGIAANGSTADAPTLMREVKMLAQKAGGYRQLRDIVDAFLE